MIATMTGDLKSNDGQQSRNPSVWVVEAQHSKVAAAALANQAGRPTDQPGRPPNIPRLGLPPGWPSGSPESILAPLELILAAPESSLAPPESILAAQEEGLFLGQEEDPLLSQEEDLLLAQENICFFFLRTRMDSGGAREDSGAARINSSGARIDSVLSLDQLGGSLNLRILGGQPGWSVGRPAWLARAIAATLEGWASNNKDMVPKQTP